MNEADRRRRDEKFRHAALLSLDLAREHSPDGCLSGESLADSANSSLAYDRKVEQPGEALRLIRDLCGLGLAEEMQAESRRQGESLGLRHRKFRITAMGVRLRLEAIAPVSGVWDERAE